MNNGSRWVVFSLCLLIAVATGGCVTEDGTELDDDSYGELEQDGTCQTCHVNGCPGGMTLKTCIDQHNELFANPGTICAYYERVSGPGHAEHVLWKLGKDMLGTPTTTAWRTSTRYSDVALGSTNLNDTTMESWCVKKAPSQLTSGSSLTWTPNDSRTCFDMGGSWRAPETVGGLGWCTAPLPTP